MLRRAVVNALKAVPLLGARVYQAFTAPADAQAPYATVKMPGGRGSAEITWAGTQTVEVRLLTKSQSSVDLDTLEASVIQALHGIDVMDVAESPPTSYRLTWVPGGGDFVEEDRQQIGRLVTFEAAVLFERG